MENIHDELVKIGEAMCEKYCKYPEKWDVEKEGMELFESEICNNCPITKLLG